MRGFRSRGTLTGKDMEGMEDDDRQYPIPDAPAEGTQNKLSKLFHLGSHPEAATPAMKIEQPQAPGGEKIG